MIGRTTSRQPLRAAATCATYFGAPLESELELVDFFFFDDDFLCLAFVEDEEAGAEAEVPLLPVSAAEAMTGAADSKAARAATAATLSFI